MRRNMSKFLSVILTVAMLFSVTVVGGYATEEYGEELDRGFCGERATPEAVIWVLYDDGTLVVSGKGAIFFENSFIDETVSDNLLTKEQELFVKRIIIEEGITSISYDAFDYMPNLVEVTFPESLTVIGSQAFMNCYSLEVFIPDTVVEIEAPAFMLVKKITVHEDNLYYSSDEYGALYNKEMTELLVYPSFSDNKEFVVHDGVEIIHNVAQYCKNLEELTIPSSVRKIEDGAFSMNMKLKKVNIAEGLEKIGNHVLYGCLALETIELPLSLKELGEYSFIECCLLENIYIKSNNISFASSCIGLCSMGPAEGVSVEYWSELAAVAISPLANENDMVLFSENTKYYDSVGANNEAVFYIHNIEEENTAEIYAEQYGITVERIHFYGEWEYDWENYLRTRKCELCEMTETEALEKETEDDVEIIAPENPELDFDVDSIDKNNDTFVLVEQQIKENTTVENEVLKVFDITLKNKDGVHVQPDGTVKVKLPLDWEKDGNYKVFRVNDDGTLTDMQAFRQGSHMVFETDHFSIYVIVEEGAAEEDTSTDEENTQSGKKDVFLFLTRLIRALEKFFMTILELLGF